MLSATIFLQFIFSFLFVTTKKQPDGRKKKLEKATKKTLAAVNRGVRPRNFHPKKVGIGPKISPAFIIFAAEEKENRLQAAAERLKKKSPPLSLLYI